ncbi:hypothetical protein ACSBR1_033392 [Camellia fascicularis]
MGDEGLNETNAEEAKEVDEGSDEGGDGGKFGKSDDVERYGGPDLIAPTMEEVVGHREEEHEENAVAGDHRTANEQLKQIRQHASPFSDGSQRVAHIFANGLAACLAGTGSQVYAALASKRITATEQLKAYQLYLSACPFMKMSIYCAGKMILNLAMKSTKKRLHIIDFGIQFGFQWPILIQHLSTLPGAAPELRITGIELPQPGFRPAELVE